MTTYCVLIIWQEIPENTTLYKVTMDDVTFKHIQYAHGHYINSCEGIAEDALEYINNALDDPTNKPANASSEYGRWADCKMTSMDISDCDFVIETGFFL